MTEVLLVLLGLGLIVASGLFVAAEFSLVTVDRSTVDRAADAGEPGASGTQSALRTLSTQLSGAQLGITITSLLIGFLSRPAVAALIDGPVRSAGVPTAAVDGASIVIALILATFLTMLFGELVPKNLAIARPFETARAVQRFIRGFTYATGPVVRFSNATANWILRRLGIEPQEELASARSPEELASLVAHSARHGTLAVETATLLQRSLAFGERSAQDAMTPRERMHALHEDDMALDVMHKARETGHSRFPVLTTDGERVRGVVNIKDAMGVPYERRAEVPVTAILVEPPLVPETMELDRLLTTLRESGLHMAIVVNEFGGIDGIVTLEDLVEEIVGEVRDEHDAPEEDVWRDRDGSWLLSGLLRPDEAGRITGIVLPEDESYETIAGLVGKELKRIAEPGDVAQVGVVDREGRPLQAVLTVEQMDQLRIDWVRLRLEPIEVEDDEGDDR